MQERNETVVPIKKAILIEGVRESIHRGAEAPKRKFYQKPVYNKNYEAFARIIWQELGSKDEKLKPYINKLKFIKSRWELFRLKRNVDEYIEPLVEWSIRENGFSGLTQFTPKQIDQIYVTLHKRFVEEKLKLNGIKKVKIREGDVFYRGIPGKCIKEDAIRKSFENNISHMPKVLDSKGVRKESWFKFKIRAKWLDTERNSVGVSASTDPYNALDYADVLDKKDGWVFIIRPPAGQEGVSLGHYRFRGVTFRELVFDNIPNRWIKEAVLFQNDKDGIYINKDNIIENENYWNIANKDKDIPTTGESFVQMLSNNNNGVKFRLKCNKTFKQEVKDTINNLLGKFNPRYHNYKLKQYKSGKKVDTYKLSTMGSKEDRMYKGHYMEMEDDEIPKFKNYKEFCSTYTGLTQLTTPIRSQENPSLINTMIDNLFNAVTRENNLLQQTGLEKNLNQQSQLINDIEQVAKDNELAYIYGGEETKGGITRITWIDPRYKKEPWKCPKEYKIYYDESASGKVDVYYGDEVSAAVMIKPDTAKGVGAAIINIKQGKKTEMIQEKQRIINKDTFVGCVISSRMPNANPAISVR